MNVLLLCFLLSSLVGNALSATYVVEPLDIQLPLIARIGQPFSWTFSERTFNSSEGSLNYTTSALPSWLSFHPDNRTFSGVPGPEDEGNPRVVVTARSPNPNSYASSGVNLCVTHYPAPTVRIPISDQFSAPGRALSSVFPLQPRSALATSNPALRIPQGWSFSVGFQASTVSSPNDLFYEARSADGSELPTWMVFDPDAVTLDGVVPQDVGSAAPEVMSFILVGSDQEGYTALALPFDLVVANHELSSSTDELPTINVTTGNTFTVNLLSPADFMGILVDGDRIQPANISMLNIDTSAYSQWLQYDPVGRTLSGNPGPDVGDTKPVLPVTLTTAFNQTIHTAVTLQLVPSYFALPELPALHLSPGDDFDLQLDQFYSNSTAGQRGDADISLTYDPVQAADFVRFDGSGDRISGAIPRDFGGDHITVSFTAYSRITHSTSHANLVVFVSPSPGGRDGQIGRPAGLSAQARRKLALGLGIAFGAVGGFLAMIAFFACCRRWTRVEDTALTGEEGRMGYTEKDRRYYGFGSSNPSLLQRPEDVARTEASIAPSRNAGEYGAVDLDLQRMPARSQSIPGSYMPSDIMSSGMISKREFMTRIKQTVRQVSDKYTRKPQVSSPRPVIGKPILLRPSVAMDNNATPDVTYPMQSSVSNPFDDRFSQRGSTFMTGSPSTSTAEHSIPRRRADFGPPRAMAQVHFNDGKLVRQGSSGSMKSDRPGRSSRQTSVRSGRSTRTTSYLSHEYYPDGDPASARPRLVPFTSSTRVPVPRVSSLVVPGADDSGGGGGGGFAKSRVASQRARIYKGNAKDEDDPFAENARRRKSVSADDLSMGLHYVQSLGNDQSAPAEPATGMTRSGTNPSNEATRYVVRTGEKFHIRIQIPITTRPLQVQQVSGIVLPSFLRFDANGAKGMIEFTGTALSRDLGILNVGIYADNECLSRVIIEVIPRR